MNVIGVGCTGSGCNNRGLSWGNGSPLVVQSPFIVDLPDDKQCSHLDLNKGSPDQSQLKGEPCDTPMRVLCEVDCL